MNKALSLLCLLTSSQLAACWTAQHEPSAGSQTHFLATCETSCAAPYACVCGVCTLHCAGDSQCSASAAKSRCLPPTAATSEPACTAEAVCDVACTQATECNGLGTGYTCTGERCRRIALVKGVGLDAGALPADAGTLPPADAGKLADARVLQPTDDAAVSRGDAGGSATCDQDSDCAFNAESNCCGECLAPAQPVTARPKVCVVDCVPRPGGCSCVNHHCARGSLIRGDSCDPAQDACGNGLGCCPTCLPHGPGDAGSCSGRGPQCSPLSSFNPKTCPLL